MVLAGIPGSRFLRPGVSYSVNVTDALQALIDAVNSGGNSMLFVAQPQFIFETGSGSGTSRTGGTEQLWECAIDSAVRMFQETAANKFTHNTANFSMDGGDTTDQLKPNASMLTKVNGLANDYSIYVFGTAAAAGAFIYMLSFTNSAISAYQCLIRSSNIDQLQTLFRSGTVEDQIITSPTEPQGDRARIFIRDRDGNLSCRRGRTEVASEASNNAATPTASVATHSGIGGQAGFFGSASEWHGVIVRDGVVDDATAVADVIQAFEDYEAALGLGRTYGT